MAKIGVGIGQKVNEKEKKKPGSIVDSLLNNKEKTGTKFDKLNSNKPEELEGGLFLGRQQQPNDAFQAAIQKLMGGVNNGFTSAGIRKPTIAMPQQTQPIMQQQPAMSSGAENYARRLMQLSTGSGAAGVAMPAGVKPVGTEVQQPKKAGMDYASKVAQRQVQTPERNILATAEPAQVQEPEKVKKGYDYAQKMMQQGGSDQTGKVGKVNPVVSSVMAKTGPAMEKERQEKLRETIENDQAAGSNYLKQMEAQQQFYQEANDWASRMKALDKDADNKLNYRNYFDTLGEGVKYGAWDNGGEIALTSSGKLQEEVNDLDSQIEYQNTIDYSDEGIAERKERIKKLGTMSTGWLTMYNGSLADNTPLVKLGYHQYGKPEDYHSGAQKKYNGEYINADEYYDYIAYDMTHMESVAELNSQLQELIMINAADPNNQQVQAKLNEVQKKLSRVRTEASEIWASLYIGDAALFQKAARAGEAADREAKILSQQLDPDLPARLENQRALRENMLKFRSILDNPDEVKQFDASKLPPRDVVKDDSGNFVRVHGDDADVAYYYANVPYEYIYQESRDFKIGMDKDGNWYSNNPNPDKMPADLFPSNTRNSTYMFMTKDERDIFNTLYLSNRKDEAEYFLDLISDSLATRQEKYEDAERRWKTDNGFLGALEAAGTAFTMPAAAVLGTAQAIGAKLGIEGADNAHSDLLRPLRWNQSVRDEVGQIWENKAGKSGKFWSGVIFSMADNLVALGLAKFGTAGSRIDALSAGDAISTEIAQQQALTQATAMVQLVMSTEATGNKFLEQIEQGVDPKLAADRAFVSGITEAFTERYSIEYYLNPNNADRLIRRLAKSFIAEGTEEVAADWMYALADDVVSGMQGQASELKEKYDQLVKQYGKSEAWSMVLGDFLEQNWESFLAGAISGLGLGANSYASSVVQSNIMQHNENQQIGTRIQNGENAAGNIDLMLEMSRKKAMSRSTQRLAADIQEDIQKKGEAKPGDLGKLARKMVGESNSRKEAKVYEQYYADRIQEELTKRDLSLSEASKQAKIIAKAAVHGMDSLTRAENATVMENMTAAEMLLEETKAVAAENGKYQEAAISAKLDQTAARSVAGMAVRGEDIKSTVLQSIASKSEEKARQEAAKIRQESGKNMATAEEIEDAARNTQRKGTNSEVVMQDEDGRTVFGDLTGGLKLVTEQNEEGNKAPQLKAQVMVDGKPAEMYLSDLKATNPEMAKLFTMARERATMLGADYLGKAITEATRLGDNISERFADEAIDLKFRAFMGLPMAADMTMDEQAANTLYNTALEERKKLNAAAQKSSKQIIANMNKTGTITLDGVAMTREQIAKKVKGKSGLGREIEVAAAIADVFNLDVDIVKKLSDEEYGSTNIQNGKIQLAYGEDFSEGIKRSVLNTLPHELAHWLRAVSTEAFNNLQDVAFKGLMAKGIDIVQLVKQQYDAYAEQGIYQTMDVAMEDVVAKACEEMIASETFKNYMQQNMEKSTFQRIRDYVRGFIEKLGKVIFRIGQTSHYEAQQLGQVREQLAKVWLDERERIMTSPAVQEAIEESRNISTEELRAKDQELGAVAPSFKQSLAGRMAKGVFGQDVARAIAMHRQGIDNDTILEETNCIPGYRDGQYYRVLDNDKVKVLKTDLRKDRYYAAYEIIQAEELFEAYPDLMNINVMVTDELPEGVIGRASQSGLQLSAQRFESYQNDLKRDMIKLTMLHELEHYRQMMEGDYRGSSPEEWTMYKKDAIAEEQIAGREIEELKKKYGMTLDDDISGLKFVRGEIDPNSVTPEVYQKLQNMDLMDQWALRTDIEQMGLWGSVLYRADQTIKTPVENYKKTIGEINARAASERSGAEQYNPIDYRGAMDADAIMRKSKTAQQMMAGNVRYSAKQADVDYAKAVADGNITQQENIIKEDVKSADAVTYDDNGEVIPPSERFNENKKDIRYSVKQTYNMSWGEQVGKYLNKELNSHDVLTVTKKGEMTKYGIDKPITMAQSVMTKGMKLIDVNKSRSAHSIEEEKVKLLSEAVKNPIAKIESDKGVILITDLKKNNKNIIAVGRNMDQYIKGGTLDIKSFYDRDDMTTLFGKYENGHFVPNQSAKITQYKNSAREVLSNSTKQYDAGAEVLDAIDSLTEKGEKDNTRESLKVAAQEVGLKALDNGDIETDSGETVAKELPGGTVAKYSLRSWREDNQEKIRDMLVKSGFTTKQADKWIGDVNSIAAMIAEDPDRLDYIPDRRQRYKKPNSDVYKYTLDASTLCKKRLEYQGTLNAIQAALPNTVLKPGDLIELANMMREMGHVTPCGICYVESNRRHAGNFSEQFINSYAKNHPDGYIPTLADLVSTDGLYKLRDQHPEVYRAYIAANNRRGSGSVKPVQMRTDYRKDLRRMAKATVEHLNSVGGLRIQSFSDFETPHLIDMTQALLDMSAKGLKGQAYTKVPDFAWVFGPSGIKINLSLMGEGNGVDADGNLIFSSKEGMDFDEAMKLRDAYSDNVGTILVGMNREHIIAAMGDSRIDFIIPFHKSGWSNEELSKMDSLKGYQDFQATQNERNVEDGKKAAEAIALSDYWNKNRTGTENAEAYLDLCAERGLIPKFDQFLVDNGDGTYSLPTDDSKESQAIRNGYWKTLIDFKMYNNEGVGVEQNPVTADINMDEARRVLGEYEGGANTLPVAQDVVDRFVQQMQEKEEDGQDIRYSKKRGVDWDVNEWMERMQPWQLRTESERQLLADYKDLRMKIRLQNQKISDYQDRLKALQAKTELTESEKKLMEGLNIRIRNAQSVKEEMEQKLIDVTGDEGYAKIMMQQSKFVDDFLAGRTQDDVAEAVNRMQKSAESVLKRIDKAKAGLKDVAESESVKRIKAMNSVNPVKIASEIRKEYGSKINSKELADGLLAIRLKIENGTDPEEVMSDVEALAGRVLEEIKENKSEYLGMLRGTTITLGPGQVKELLGSNRTMKDLRAVLAGTGIKVKAATKEQIHNHEATGLDSSWEELCDMIPMLNRDTYEGDQVAELVRFVQEEKKRMAGTGQYREMLPEAINDIMDRVLGNQISADMDPKMRQELDNLSKYVEGLAGKAVELSDALEGMRTMMADVIKSGQQTATWTDAMKRDVANTIEYFDRTAKLAQDTARNEHLRQVIANLKSEAAQKLLETNQQWRELMERDRQARMQDEENDATRRKMNTVISRVNKLLSAPKGLNNIPEHMQGLARELMETLVDNDISGGRKITTTPRKQLYEMKRKLTAWKARDGEYNAADMNLAEDSVALWKVEDDLNTIREAIAEWNGRYNGKNNLENVQMKGATLKRMQEAVSELYSFIKSEQNINILDHQISIADQAEKIKEQIAGKISKEWTGKLGGAINAVNRGIVLGNMTPEYIFRMLDNEGLSDLWDDRKYNENRNGLEMKKAQDVLQEIAEKHNYSSYDMKEKHEVQLANGKTVKLTTGQLMSLYATWNREQTLGPEMSEHLTKGGFFAEEDTRGGIVGKLIQQKRANRVTEADMATVNSILTDEQRALVDDVVRFMSEDMSKLGNEASMKAFGMKIYKEKYYFPFKMWDGIKSRKTNEAGQAAQNQAFHPSFSKSRMHGANNALIIGDFMETATDHIIGMINYATMGLSNDNYNKVMNAIPMEGDENGEETKRNIRTMIKEAYGQNVDNYLEDLKKQLEGGVAKANKDFYDKTISLFRKNAVAGSLSVALQQPLSYLRAGIVISPKYLTQALGREYWKGSYQEMLQHSGVAVIKDMGKFDMNAGASAREYITPDGYKSTRKKIWDFTTDKLTILPEKMDAWTWTRMWVATKLEQKALHPEMDVKSDEFLDTVAERFNDIMRRTQVYDSVMVRSANMRSDKPWKKSLTSFMAEPTLTLNILADAVRQVKEGKPGAVKTLAATGAATVLSAILQAAVKGAAGAGRNPDDDKTALENFLYRFGNSAISELDPLTLIPGYSDAITLLKEGELADDAMGSIGKMLKAAKGMPGVVENLITGDSSRGLWRDVEDSVGQIVQLYSNLPMKNLMRDARMMYNWVIDQQFAERENSAAVIKYQALDSLANADNLAGAINKFLVEGGYGGYDTKNNAYYQRIYDAKQAGDYDRAAEMEEYLTLGKGVKEKSITSKMGTMAKNDENISAVEAAEFMRDEDVDPGQYIRDQLKQGNMTAEEATKQLRETYPDKSDDSIFWTVDRIEYEKETGKDASGTYYRLWDAMDGNRANDIEDAVNMMMDHGVDAKNIKSQITKHYKALYLEADTDGKRKIMDAIQKAYKKLGYDPEDAKKVINKWK